MVIDKRYFWLTMGLSSIFLLFFSLNAPANSMTYEQKLNACAACHGVNGDKPVVPSYPILAGQYEDYLVNSLQAYKSGRRIHPIMNAQVKLLGLTDSDINRLSRHFSKKKSLKGLAE
ncbi:MAG: hypothetical protein CBC29_00215 [Methylococcaceae bacterium TMED69]|nr:MAG: hypothetical protein CBC29_00215 [Methylococcaceae bacterium TMED69]